MIEAKRRSIFFTSDWHIGHENVLKYDQRPFKDLEDMHRILINNYNSTVPEDGICYFLGDIGFYKDDLVKNVISQLNGTKVAILGNHDKGPNSVYNCGFDVVLYGAKMIIAGEEVTLSHCPLRGVFRENIQDMKGSREGDNWHGEFKNYKFSLPDFRQFHIHGHTHKAPEERTLLKQFDVGVRANNYRPVSISVIESWISTYGR